MKYNLDELLKRALTPKEEPGEALNRKILDQVKEEGSMKNRRFMEREICRRHLRNRLRRTMRTAMIKRYTSPRALAGIRWFCWGWFPERIYPHMSVWQGERFIVTEPILRWPSAGKRAELGAVCGGRYTLPPDGMR